MRFQASKGRSQRLRVPGGKKRPAKVWPPVDRSKLQPLSRPRPTSRPLSWRDNRRCHHFRPSFFCPVWRIAIPSHSFLSKAHSTVRAQSCLWILFRPTRSRPVCLLVPSEDIVRREAFSPGPSIRFDTFHGSSITVVLSVAAYHSTRVLQSSGSIGVE